MMELYGVILVYMLCHVAAVPLNLIRIPEGQKAQSLVSDLQLLIPIKHRAYPKYEDHRDVEKERYESFPNGGFSHIPDEEFIRDDLILDGNVKKRTVKKNLSGLAQSLSNYNDLINFGIATGHKFYPSHLYSLNNARNSQNLRSQCLQYLQRVDLRSDHELIKSFCNRLLKLKIDYGSDIVSAENFGFPEYAMVSDRTDDKQYDDNHGHDFRGTDTDGKLNKGQVFIKAILNALGLGIEGNDGISKFIKYNTLFGNRAEKLGVGEDSYHIKNRDNGDTDSSLSQSKQASSNNRDSSNNKLITHVAATKKNVISAGHILPQILNLLTNVSVFGLAGDYSSQKAAARDVILKGSLNIENSAVNREKDSIEDVEEEHNDNEELKSALDKDKAIDTINDAVDVSKDFYSVGSLAVLGDSGLADDKPTKNDSSVKCLHVNLYIEDKDKVNLRSKEQNLPITHRMNVVKATTPKAVVSDTLSKFRPMGGRRDWVTIRGQHDKRNPYLVI